MTAAQTTTNVSDALADTPEESANLQARSTLMRELSANPDSQRRDCRGVAVS
ncbi:MAG: hypothetical protein IPN06_17430 [Burkholderiales bacterium]|nr:hypothetical protein [Burkholderiales bacterium]